MEINKQCSKALIPYVTKFINGLMEQKIPIEDIVQNYDELKKTEGAVQCNMFQNFINLTLERKDGVKLLYNILQKNNIEKKIINKFLYQFLKLKHKQKYKLWSWFEAMEFDIDDSDIENTTTKYTVI